MAPRIPASHFHTPLLSGALRSGPSYRGPAITLYLPRFSTLSNCGNGATYHISDFGFSWLLRSTPDTYFDSMRYLLLVALVACGAPTAPDLPPCDSFEPAVIDEVVGRPDWPDGTWLVFALIGPQVAPEHPGTQVGSSYILTPSIPCTAESWRIPGRLLTSTGTPTPPTETAHLPPSRQGQGSPTPQ